MTRLPPPEQWALCKMNEMEVAEMIEQHIDFYTVDKDGSERSVHLPTQFVRHFMRRDDGALPTTVAYATMPLVLADGNLLAPKGLDRQRGIQFIIPDALRAVIPQPQDCTPERVKAAMEFLCDEWLVDVATDYTGKALLIAAALTLIERSLLDNRPCFFVTAGRRGSGKTTAIYHADHGASSGILPAASAWSSNEEERRKALMSHFLVGMPYILWDNIPRGLQISVPAHREVLHFGVLFRPPARRQRDSPRQRRRPSISSPATISGRRATWPRAASTSGFPSIAPTPRTGRSSIRTRSAGPRTTAAKSWRRSTPSCSEIPSSRSRTTPTARPGSRCGGGWSAPRSSTRSD